jgi:ankyrin repeat protein
MTEELTNAAQHGDIHKCSRLLNSGVNVNEVDSAGFLPIHYACSVGNVDIARLLLEFGSDVTSYLTGYAPIEICARNGHSSIIQLLVYFGGDVEETGSGGCPPIVSAAANGHAETLAVLIELGANVNKSDLGGNTALHCAAKLEDPVPCIHILMRTGADIRLANKHGQTPMHIALSIMNIPALQALGGRLIDQESIDSGVSLEEFFSLDTGNVSGVDKVNIDNVSTHIDPKTKKDSLKVRANSNSNSKSTTIKGHRK